MIEELYFPLSYDDIAPLSLTLKVPMYRMSLLHSVQRPQSKGGLSKSKLKTNTEGDSSDRILGLICSFPILKWRQREDDNCCVTGANQDVLQLSSPQKSGPTTIYVDITQDGSTFGLRVPPVLASLV